MNRLEELNLKLNALVIFHRLLDDGALRLLPAVLASGDMGMERKVSNYAAFAAALFEKSVCLSDYLWELAAADPNAYVMRLARGEQPEPELERCLDRELQTLQELSSLTAGDELAAIGNGVYLPVWTNRSIDFAVEYRRRASRVSELGYGMFTVHHMFSVSNGRVLPVLSPDTIRLSHLSGYESERQAVVQNSLALLRGAPAANVLLYGDAGTGKSSTVKAIVNEYADRGLRLVEIRKQQLNMLPAVLESLQGNPLKFILFIDDLSFTAVNEEIGALKAILEGSVSAKAKNTVIYATSNRRHLIDERFSDRADDELNRNETIQEQVSLSDRFGLAVRFARPDKEQYLAIVRALAAQYGVEITVQQELLAERWALERGGRSPRVARQFVESVAATHPCHHRPNQV